MIAITFGFYFAIERQPPLNFLFPQNGEGRRPRRSRSRWRTTSSTSTVRRSVCTSSTSANLAHGDFGICRRSRTASWSMGPRSTLRTRRCERRCRSSIGGAVLVVLLALPLGAISGSRIGSWADRVISFGALVLVCFHPMMLGLILRNAGGTNPRPADRPATARSASTRCRRTRRLLPTRLRALRRPDALVHPPAPALAHLRAAVPRALHPHDSRERRGDDP